MILFKIISDSGVKIAALGKEKNSWTDLTNSYESGFYLNGLSLGRIAAGEDAKFCGECRRYRRARLLFVENLQDEWPCGWLVLIYFAYFCKG